MSKPSKPSKKPSRSSKSSKSSRTSKSSQPSSAPAKSKDSSKNKRPGRSSSVSIEEVQPRPCKCVCKPAATSDEESEDVSWVDRQDSLPPEEVAEGEPEKDTLEWHQWNLTLIWDKKKEKFLHRFQCKYSESVICMRAVGDSTATNLKRHADLCDAKHGKDMTTQMKVTSSIPRQFHKGEFRLQLVEWVTRWHRPDIIVEDDELVQLFSYLNPSVKTPLRPTLRRDLHAVFSLTLLEGLYPDLRKKIDTRLENLRTAGIALTLLTIRGIMVACIQHDAPHLFMNRMPNGSRFKCSEAFVKKYLYQLHQEKHSRPRQL
ncbi:hypothetical protein FB446DRAFT_795322 [Lentinula raphanica]|nr:hypothetical protein FB446DRAFT_795322 [Lentinula raphanica]